jgi:hypothetical protein
MASNIDKRAITFGCVEWFCKESMRHDLAIEHLGGLFGCGMVQRIPTNRVPHFLSEAMRM